jgi:hypothetical protein
MIDDVTKGNSQFNTANKLSVKKVYTKPTLTILGTVEALSLKEDTVVGGWDLTRLKVGRSINKE